MVHAYYEFQHVELSNVGSGKKKVLKPPGGGSSNIFSGEESPCRPTRANRMASSIALGDCGSETASVSSSPPSTPRKPGSPNPVTSEDFVDKKVVNAASVAAPPPQQKRSRVPPGGHSSKLW